MRNSPAACVAATATMAVVLAGMPPVAATPSGDELDRGWLEAVNFYRQSAGADPVDVELDWQPPVEQAAQYIVRHNDVTHELDPDRAGYTEEAARAASESNLYGHHRANTPAIVDIDGWVRSPLHGLMMLRPTLRRTAYGAYRDPDADGLRAAAGLNVHRGSDHTAVDGDAYPLVFPGDGDRVPVASSSNPADAGCGRDSHGLPIRLFLDPDGDPRLTGSQVRVNGEPVEHCAADYATYTTPREDSWRPTLEREGAVLVTPDAPLQPGDTVEVAVDTAVDGPLEWAFEIAPGSTIAAHPEPPAWSDGSRLDAHPAGFTDDGGNVIDLSWDRPTQPAGYAVSSYAVRIDGDPPDAFLEPADGRGARIAVHGAAGDTVAVSVEAQRSSGFAAPHPETVSVALPEPPRVDRLAGADRVDTAVAVSAEAFPDGAEMVLLARADEFADALTAAPLAAARNAPLLLTAGDQLPPTVASEIARLEPSKVVALGGRDAVTDAVLDGAAPDGAATARLGGATRFGTAVAVADELTTVTPDDRDVPIYVADGLDGWPDAVTASAVAAHQGAPLLLTAGDTPPETTLAAARTADVDRAIIVGGNAVIGEQAEAELRAVVGHTRRLAGHDRYATAAAVRAHAQKVGMTADQAWVTTGRNWPDALVAGGPAGARGAPLHLVGGRNPQSEPSDTLEVLARRRPPATFVVGGTAAVSTAFTAEIERLVQGR
jgi:putative cell wall-binding protein